MFIYGLYSGQLVLYVGKTKSTLKRRAIQHRSKYNDTSSKYIPPYIDWEIRLIEECEESNGALKEQYWFDTLKPLYNRCRPYQTRRETRMKYQQTEARKEAQRRYAQTETYKESQKKYKEKIKTFKNASLRLCPAMI